MVSGSIVDHGLDPIISELIPGTWAQRCDVLRVGDVVVGINGVSTATMTQRDLTQMLDKSDRVQLEVRYPLPPRPPNVSPNSRSRVRTKVIQVTLRKENGSFGMVIRGGNHESARKRRPFTCVQLTPGGPAFNDGTIRVNDRIRSVNGVDLKELKLPELQSLLYRQVRTTIPLTYMARRLNVVFRRIKKPYLLWSTMWPTTTASTAAPYSWRSAETSATFSASV